MLSYFKLLILLTDFYRAAPLVRDTPTANILTLFSQRAQITSLAYYRIIYAGIIHFLLTITSLFFPVPHESYDYYT